MANQPAITTHPDRASIEIGLANNVALRTLSKRYGISITALSLYRKHHMPEELIARLRVRGCRSDEELARIREVESKSLVDHFSFQRSRLYAVADRSARIGDDMSEIRAFSEARRVSESIAKLLGEMGQHITVNNTQVNLLADPCWHLIRTELVRALRPYPEAWSAAVSAIERVEAQQTQLPNLLEHEPLATDETDDEALEAAA